MNEEVKELSLLGVLSNGTPVWAMFGSEGENDDDAGNDDDDNSDDGNDDSDDDGTDDDDEQKKLNDAGKRALDRERDRRKKAVKDLAPWSSLSREFGSPDEIRAKLAGASTEDVNTVRAEANKRVEAIQKNVAKLAVRALATDFADPDDASAFVNLSSIEVGDNGEVDEDEIRDQLAEILERKPHLKKSATDANGGKNGARRPRPDKSQGGGKNTGGRNSSATLEAGAERYRRLMGKN